MATVYLTNEWREWIADNLARGCDPKALIAEMIKAGFEPGFSSATVFGISDGKIAPVTIGFRLRAAAHRAGQSDPHAGPHRARDVAHRAPIVVFLDDVLSHDECDQLIERSRDRLSRSTTVDPASGNDAVIDARSSEGTLFPLNADPLIAKIDARVSAIMNLPVENGEGLQILHYHTGGQYTPHYDYFAPSDPGSATHIANGGQRVSSLVMYLNDVEAGGETVFPELRLTVGPKKGGGVYFEYCNSRSELDPLSLHGGLPVLKGEKWIATKWMRSGPLLPAVVTPAGKA